MTNQERIEVGDTVEVSWRCDEMIIRGVILYIPGSTGDAWIIKNSAGKIFYIQMYECMSLVEKKP